MKYKIILLILLHIAASAELFPLARYVMTCRSELIQASADSAIAQVGVKERTGRNDGYMVEQYLKSVGLRKGNPYCAAGQYWCFYSACQDLSFALSEIPIKRTGSTVSMFNHAMKNGRKTFPFPKVNDLIFWKKPRVWRGHVERIIEVMKAGWIRTVGFNTSSGRKGSQDDGEGVYIRKRNYKHFIGRMAVRGFVGFTSVNS